MRIFAIPQVGPHLLRDRGHSDAGHERHRAAKSSANARAQVADDFIAAFPEERVQAQALKAGAACVLSKPFNARTLIEYLDAVMKSHGGRSRE